MKSGAYSSEIIVGALEFRREKCAGGGEDPSTADCNDFKKHSQGGQ